MFPTGHGTSANSISQDSIASNCVYIIQRLKDILKDKDSIIKSPSIGVDSNVSLSQK